MLHWGSYEGGNRWIQDPHGDVPHTASRDASTHLGGLCRPGQQVPGIAVNTDCKFYQADGTQWHKATAFSGNRFSRVWCTSKNFKQADYFNYELRSHMEFSFPETDRPGMMLNLATLNKIILPTLISIMFLMHQQQQQSQPNLLQHTNKQPSRDADNTGNMKE